MATAFDIWRTKRNKHDKKSFLLKKSQQIVKKSKKKAKWSYQKKQLTLKNIDKAQNLPSTLPSNLPSSTSLAPTATVNQLLLIRPKLSQQQHLPQSPKQHQHQQSPKQQQSPIYVSPTSPIRPKWYCDLCKKQSFYDINGLLLLQKITLNC